MESREMRAFVVAAEEGGMSAAARRPHLSRPVLSQTISALERELGVGLVRRHPIGPDLDAIPVVEEPLGVLPAAEPAQKASAPEGIRLNALAVLNGSDSPVRAARPGTTSSSSSCAATVSSWVPPLPRVRSSSPR